MSTLARDLAPRILPVVLANVTTRYPYYDAHLMQPGDVPRDPTLVHPAFGNSFDWHSSVHSHWTALQVLEYVSARNAGESALVEALQTAIRGNLTAANIHAETAYVRARPGYERPYGWAWALLLASSAQSAAGLSGADTATSLRTLAETIARTATAWLGMLSEPVRHGVHANTAFALGLMLDAGRALDLADLPDAIATRAGQWFGDDREWPEAWERSGNDFLSPGLAEADLMRRLLAPADFDRWWKAFLPHLSSGSRILSVVSVPDVRDGHIVHLHGLNLSRAGMLARIAVAVHDPALVAHAHHLYQASVEHAISGDYLATHWLATFAWDAAVSLDVAKI